MAREPAAVARRDRPIVLVHVRDEIVGDVPFPVPRRHRVRVHAAAKGVHRIRHDENHVARRPAGEDALGDQMQLSSRGAEVAEVGSRVSVQQVHDRISTRTVGRVTRRQIDGYLRFRRLAQQIAFERLAMHLDPLELAFERGGRRRGRWQNPAPVSRRAGRPRR